MLRRKMVVVLGSFLLLLVTLIVTGLWMLENVLRHLDQINAQTTVIIEKAGELHRQITLIEVELYQIDIGTERHLDDLIDSVEALRGATGEIGRFELVSQGECKPVFERMVVGLDEFTRFVGTLATVQDSSVARRTSVAAMRAASDLRTDILHIGLWAQALAKKEQLALAREFRMVIVGLSVGALVLVNLGIAVQIRMAMTVLRPVERLVEAARQLALERFDHRVALKQNDEFDELARAFNRLAEQLQANEQRRLETMGQVALTLNHELNNALSVIELQLRLLAKQVGTDPDQLRGMRQIRDALGRMARTVEQLKHVRRIVLTDYVSGVKMLDLDRSVAEEPAGLEAKPDAGGSDATAGQPAAATVKGVKHDGSGDGNHRGISDG